MSITSQFESKNKDSKAIRENFDEVVSKDGLHEITLCVRKSRSWGKPCWATVEYQKSGTTIRKNFDADYFDDLLQKVTIFIKNHE